MNSVYVIGAPGAGKTTGLTAARITLGWYGVDPVGAPVPAVMRNVTPRVVELGKDRPAFGGTDTLGMGIGPDACTAVRSGAFSGTTLLIGEGDRLAYDGFFQALADCSERFTVLWVDGEESVMAGRRSQRAEAHGMKPQSAAWVKGRTTKVLGLAQRWANNLVRVDANLPEREVAAAIARVIGVQA